jgi:FKBP-type peptidyl-prolyl cis-trans isomerase
MIYKLIPAAFALSFTALATAQIPAEEKAPAKPAAATEAPADPAATKTDASYVFGFRTGASFAQEYSQYGISAADIEAESFLKGFIGALKGDKPELSEDKTRAALKALGDILQMREVELGAKNLEIGKKFLEENAKKPGIITTKSGLQYQILEKGGDKKYLAPKESDLSNKEFMVNYEGSVINGTQFDRSPPGKPTAMNLDVIDGVKEALTNMPIGAKWKIFIPANLAYGEKRRSGQIGPNQLLIFELELLEIKDAAPAPEGNLPFPMPPADPAGE